MLAITTWIWRERKVVKSASCFIGLICLVIVMGLTNGIVLVRKNQGNWSYMNPFKNYDYDNSLHRLIYSDDYIQDHTILHYFAICFHGYCCHKERSPIYLTEANFDEIRNSNALFARKFRSPESDELVKLIDNMI